MTFKHLFVEQKPTGGKTDLWLVRSKHGEQPCLGRVAWFGRWRKYAFFPEPGCVFEEVCMRELSEFIEEARS